MKTRTVYAIGAIAISAIALAQGVKFLQTPNGNMKVKYTSFALSKISESNYKMIFKGAPVQAEWGTPKTTVECADFSGVAKLKGKKDLEIVTAEMKGGVHLVALAKSQSKGSDVLQTVDLKGSSADYNAQTGVVNLLGQVVVDNEDKPASRSMHMTGSSATVTLYPNSSEKGQTIKAAILKGPVQFAINGVRTMRDEKTGKTSNLPLAINGKADSMSYDAVERKLVLAGHVVIDSDDPLVSADGLTDATIWFDDKFDPIRAEMNGDPGSASFKQKGAKG